MSDSRGQLEIMFGEMSDAAESVLAIIDGTPGVAWQAQELAEQCSLRLVDALLILARLTVAGMIEHPGLGAGYTARQQRLPRAG